MKTLSILFLGLLSHVSFAKDVTFELHPQDFESKCLGDKLVVNLMKLRDLTDSKRTEAIHWASTPAVCQAVKNFIHLNASIMITVRTDIHKKFEWIGPEICKNYQCSIVAKEFKVESFKFSIREIAFQAEHEIIGTALQKIETWDDRECAPYAPNCDL